VVVLAAEVLHGCFDEGPQAAVISDPLVRNFFGIKLWPFVRGDSPKKFRHGSPLNYGKIAASNCPILVQTRVHLRPKSLFLGLILGGGSQ
jgi:hypothetical protein